MSIKNMLKMSLNWIYRHWFVSLSAIGIFISILASFPPAWDQLKKVIDWLVKLFSRIWQFAIQPQLSLVHIFVVAILLLFIVFIIKKSNKKDQESNPKQAFTEMKSEGVLWRWRWSTLRPKEIWEDSVNPYCSKCDGLLVPTDTDSNGQDIPSNVTLLWCRHCGFEKLLSRPWDYIQEMVKQEGERRRRKGQY